MASTGQSTGVVWTFQAGAYRVALTVTPDNGYRYDGEDEDGSVQDRLDSGDWVAFDSTVEVIDPQGVVIGSDHLGGSVYAWADIEDFWEAHRDSDPANRNSTANPREGVSIGHYFPDMVRTAVREARDYLRKVQARHVRPASI